jgi:hypothetical protein
MTRSSFWCGTARAAAIGIAAQAMIASSCSQAPSRAEGEPTGSVGLALQVSPGVTVTNGDYAISGPNGFMRAGTLMVGQTSDVAVVLSSIPVGTGYTLTANAVASDGITTCSGTTPFDVTGGANSSVVVHLVCRVPAQAGVVVAIGQINVCPIIEGISANPAEALVGSTLSLAAVAHDADGAPSPLAYTWSASAGSLSSTSAANPVFTCTIAGVATITVTASDGDPACTDSSIVNVTCTAL